MTEVIVSAISSRIVGVSSVKFEYFCVRALRKEFV